METILTITKIYWDELCLTPEVDLYTQTII